MQSVLGNDSSLLSLLDKYCLLVRPYHHHSFECKPSTGGSQALRDLEIQHFESENVCYFQQN